MSWINDCPSVFRCNSSNRPRQWIVPEEEVHRTIARGAHYVILPILPELLRGRPGSPALEREFSSADCLLSLPEVRLLLERHGLLSVEQMDGQGELLR